MADKITYLNKVDLVTSPALPENKVAASDLNEIKSVVNENADLTPTLHPTKQTYNLKQTADGHTLDLGQELFFEAINTELITATELNPKVFVSIGASILNPEIQDVIFALSTQVAEGSLVGINTVEALAEGQTKIIEFGRIGSVNTSNWLLGDQLYISPDTAGELTNVKPVSRAWKVAIVLSVDPTDGAIFVSPSRIADTSGVVSTGLDRIFLQADASGTVPFFEAALDDRGIIESDTQEVINGDDTFSAFPVDWLTDPNPQNLVLRSGTIEGALEYITTAGANAPSQFIAEVYRADGAGNPLSGGSGLANGDLGTDPLMVYASPVRTAAANVTEIAPVVGTLLLDSEILLGERLRIHILAGKVGTVGGNQNIDLYFGASNFSYLGILKILEANEVLYNNTLSGLTGDNVQDAIDELKGLIDALTP